MKDSQSPIKLDAVKVSPRKKKTFSAPGIVVAILLGGVFAGGIFYLLKQTILYEAEVPPTQLSVIATDDNSAARSDANPSIALASSQDEKPPTSQLPEDTVRNLTTVVEHAKPLAAPQSIDTTREESPQTTVSASLPEFPASDSASKDETPAPATKSPPGVQAAQDSGKPDDKEERKEPKLSSRKWTTLVLLNPQLKGETAIPDNFPVWNFEKGYTFSGSQFDVHRLGEYQIDGEFIIRDGYLRREFGNSALLRLPAAENFELEGLVHLEGSGGWLMLLGWDIEQKSGYAIYNTKLRVSGSMWFVVEIAEGKPVAESERLLVKRDAQGEGALRVLVDNKKVSMQAAEAYLFKEEELPHYKPGHVAIGTFSPQYGPQNIGIRSLRMKLR